MIVNLAKAKSASCANKVGRKKLDLFIFLTLNRKMLGKYLKRVPGLQNMES